MNVNHVWGQMTIYIEPLQTLEWRGERRLPILIGALLKGLMMGHTDHTQENRITDRTSGIPYSLADQLDRLHLAQLQKPLLFGSKARFWNPALQPLDSLVA